MNKLKKAGVAVAAAVGLAVASPIAPAQAAGYIAVNGCLGTGGPVGIQYTNYRPDTLYCGQQATGVRAVTNNIPFRVKKNGQSGSVCYNPGFMVVLNTNVQVWAVPSC